MTDPDAAKAAVAARALELVEPGMLLGLGTGTTAALFVDGLGRRVAQGLRVSAVATSEATAARARAWGIELREQIERPLDLAVDGADEVDPALSLIKGRGGALFREKVVAAAARRFVVLCDESKLVRRLGVGVLPVEVLPFLWRETARRLELLGASCRLRGGEAAPYLTDNGNLILDLSLPAGIEDAERVAAAIRSVVGVVEHGLFIGLARACICAGASGLRVLGSID